MPKQKSVPTEEKKPNVTLPRKFLLPVSLVVVIVVLLSSSVYFYVHYQKVQSVLMASKSADKQIESIVAKVAKHYDLPIGDKVTMAVVSDVAKLQNQSFFKKAQNGDRVLIYSKTGIAILYREKTDRIINVGPVDLQAPTPPQSAPTPAVKVSVQDIKLGIYNGTKVTGLAKKAESALQSLSALNVSVVTKGNAVNDYDDTLVVDLTGKNKEAADKVASFVKGTVVTLPNGEVKPDGAELLLILGKSYASPQPL